MEKYRKDAVRVKVRFSDGAMLARHVRNFGDAIREASTFYAIRGNDVEGIEIEQMFVKKNGEIFDEPIDK